VRTLAQRYGQGYQIHTLSVRSAEVSYTIQNLLKTQTRISVFTVGVKIMDERTIVVVIAFAIFVLGFLLLTRKWEGK